MDRHNAGGQRPRGEQRERRGPLHCLVRHVSCDRRPGSLQDGSCHREQLGQHLLRLKLTAKSVAAAACRTDVLQRQRRTAASTRCLMIQLKAKGSAFELKGLERRSAAPAAGKVASIKDDGGPQLPGHRPSAWIAELGLDVGVRKQEANVLLLELYRRARPLRTVAAPQLPDCHEERSLEARRIICAGADVPGRPPRRHGSKFRVALRQGFPSRTPHHGPRVPSDERSRFAKFCAERPRFSRGGS